MRPGSTDNAAPGPGMRSARTLLEGQRHVLEQVVAGEPLADVLASLCRLVEAQVPRRLASAILLVDAATGRLRVGAAPGLPEAFVEAMDGAPIEEGYGTCSVAALHGQPCVSTDALHDPEWRRVEAPQRLGFAASWSEPIIGASGDVLGTFGCYFPEHRGPQPEERELVAVLARTAALAIERHHQDRREREAARHDRFAAALADAMRPLTGPDAIMATTTRMLGAHLGVAQCGFARLDDGEPLGDALPDGQARAWPLPALGGAFARAMQAGEAFAVDDAGADPRLDASARAACREAGIAALLALPLRRDGAAGAALLAAQPVPRGWTAAEVDLARGVALRCRDACERARLAREVEEGQARYRAMVEATSECVMVLAPDGTLLQVNAAGLHAIEAARAADAIGRRFADLVAPEHRAAFDAFNERVCAGEAGMLAFEVTGLGGTWRWMEASSVPVRWAGDGFAHLAVARDATRRRADERARQDDRARLDYAVRLSGIGFWYCDLPFDELIWDARVKQHFWLPPDAPVTIDTFYAQIHPDDRERTRRAIEASIAGHSSYDVLYRTVDAASGAVKWIRALGGTAYDDAGAPIRFDGVTVDVTAQRRDQEHLARLLEREREQARLLGEVARAARSIYAAGSVESVLRVVTEEARRIIGAHQSVSSLSTGADWSQAIVDVSLSDKYARFRQYAAPPNGAGIYTLVCEENRPVRLTQAQLEAHPRWRGFSGEGDRHPPMRGWLAVPLVGHDGRNLGLLQLSDRFEGDFSETDEAVLTQLAQIAAVALENARLYDALREADRRKDEFLATLAHELRNPLAPIRTGLHVLGMLGLPPRAGDVHAMMERQLGHLVRLVDDLLDVSRITLGKLTLAMERIDVHEVAESAVEATRALIEARGQHLRIDLPAAPLPVDADRTRLSQVLANLLNNAARYTPQGGRITLSAGMDDGRVLIRVSDTGIGIPPELQPRIFDLFTQLDRSVERAQGGLGIGLTLVRRLVEMHGGEVSVESAGEGLGSRFTVSLPAPAVPAPRAAGAPDARALPRARRVLVVDDNLDGADTLRMALELDGHEVELAHDGHQALERVRAMRPDVVLLDIGLPGLNGFEVARRLRAMDDIPQPRVVALTGWGGEDDRRRAREAGFDGHLVKPVDPARLAAAIAPDPGG